MENQETMRTMTVQEVLEITRDMLAGIQVPVGLIKQIGEPVAAAIDNLNACLRAIEGDRKAGQLEQAVREDEAAGAVPLIDLDAETEEGAGDV
jgi:hypothetical protein